MFTRHRHKRSSVMSLSLNNRTHVFHSLYELVIDQLADIMKGHNVLTFTETSIIAIINDARFLFERNRDPCKKKRIDFFYRTAARFILRTYYLHGGCKKSLR